MSTFDPAGVELEFNGETRRLLWDYGVIEKVQEMYGGHPILAIEKMFWQSEDKALSHYQAKPVLDILEILLSNEIARQKYFDGSSSLKAYTRKELGYLVDRNNADKVISAIVASWTGSMPEVEDEEEKPKNRKSGRSTP